MRRNHRPFQLAVLLVTMSLAIIACQEGDVTTPALDIQNPAGDKSISNNNILLNRFDGDAQGLMAYLNVLDSLSNTFSYEKVIELEVVVGTAASASASPPSWGTDYEFSLDIPADALVGTQYQVNDVVNISLSVPKGNTDFPHPNLPMPMIMLPHGLDFQQEIQVKASRHPNLSASCDYGYELFYVEFDQTRPQFLVYGGFQQIPGAGPDCRLDISAICGHFSKWYLSRGRPDTTSDGGDFWDW